MAMRVSTAYRLVRYSHTEVAGASCLNAEAEDRVIDRIRGQGIQTSGVVVRVCDGDCIVVSGTLGIKRVRLLGIDGPELWHPTRGTESRASESREALVKLAYGRRVVMIGDSFQPAHDRYGRWLSWVIRQDDEMIVNLEMVREGWAWATPWWPNALRVVLKLAEIEARRSGLGLWGGEKPSMVIDVRNT